MRPSLLRRAVTLCLSVATLVLATGCDDPFNPGGGADARLNVTALLNSAPVATMVVEVTGEGIPSPLVFNLAISGGVASGTITVPAGSDRTVTMRAYDANGIETHRGVRSISVAAGNNPAVILTLTPLSGSVPISVSLGSIFLSLNPGNAGLYVGDTLRLVTDIVDANGVPIVGSVAYAMVTPGVVTIGANGLLTGHRPGSTWIVATYEGFAVAGNFTVDEGTSDVTWSMVNNEPGITSVNFIGGFGFSTSDMWATASSGQVWRYDGTSWTQQNIAGLGSGISFFYSAWGTSSADMWVVGSGGRIIRYNGTSWTQQANPFDNTAVQFLSVWGTSSSDVWVAGTSGTLMHWNGSGWTVYPVEVVTGSITGISGTASNSVYISGHLGYVWHWDGDTLTTLRSGGADLRGIHARSDGDVRTVGAGGTIHRYDGGSWTTETSGVSSNLRAVFATPGGTWYVVGTAGTLLHSSGNGSWTNQSSASIISWYSGLWGVDGEVYAFGDRGTIQRHNATSWTLLHRGGAVMYGVYAASPTRVWAVGTESTILRWNGTNWATAVVPHPDNHVVYAISGRGDDHVFAVGTGGYAWHYDGTTWSVENLPVGGYMGAVHVAANGAVWVAGTNGTVLRRAPGGGWSVMRSGGGMTLDGVFAISDHDVYAVGTGGTIFHYDGVAWTQQVSPANVYFDDVWAANADEVFIVGGSGTILRKVGTTWVQDASGTSNHLYSIWGTSASNMIVGGSGAIRRWDGGSWTAQSFPAGVGTMTDVWGSSARDVWGVAPSANRVLRGTPAAAAMSASASAAMAAPTAGETPRRDVLRPQ